MIAVISPLQLGTGFLVGHFLSVCQLVKLFFKIIVNLLSGYSAKTDIHFLHGNIIQVIQVTEYADLAEFSDPGKESQFDTAVHRFEHTVERFQRVAIRGLQLFVADGLQKRFVVFIDKDGYPLTGLLAGTFHDTLEA